jgi:hypothetical protein
MDFKDTGNEYLKWVVLAVVENNIKMYFREIGYEYFAWIALSQG